MRKTLPEVTWKSLENARSDWRHARFEFKPDEQVKVPTFCDDQEYSYYSGVARDGTLTEPLAFRLTYDAYTLPQLYRMYSDDSEVPPGIGIFEYPYMLILSLTLSRRRGR